VADHSQRPLAGRAAVVTGASSGIGRAIALEFAAAGADVLVHARASREAVEATAAEVRRFGRESQVLLYDLGVPDEQDTLVDQAWNWRPIDVWMNNAGADVLTGLAADWTFEEKLDTLWRVDVLGTIRASRACGRRMKKRGRGVILNMSWDQALAGMGGDAGEAFTTTKGAIAAFSRSLAKSLAPEVRVNCLAPGWIRTAWGEQASDYWQERAVAESLLERWGKPEEVARVARFLASADAEFITGQLVNINGGYRGGG